MAFAPSCETPRLIARVLRDVLQTETFETIADVKAALYDRCRALKIPCEHDTLNRAIDMLASNHHLVRTTPRRKPAMTVPVAAVPTSVTKGEASRTLARLGVDASGGRFDQVRQVRGTPDTPSSFPRLMKVSS